jgi:H+/Cl- antiporter ClcA
VSELAAFFGVTNTDISAALIAMGMAGFLAAVTQAPLTSFIIVMEMVDGHSMVLSLMTTALIASLISRLICRPLYLTLAEHMVRGIVPRQDNEGTTIERK